MSVLCVIPARGGSTRIKRKNVREFAGSPMLVHALRAALESDVFDHVHVSTEDDEIASVATAAGCAPIFRRDPMLADEHTPIRQVVKNDLQRFLRAGYDFDLVALVYATAALIDSDDLRRAVSAFSEKPTLPLLAVVDAGAPIERMMVDRNGILYPAISDAFTNRSQELSATYRDAGAFCFFSARTLKDRADEDETLVFRPFVLPYWKGVDIDTEDDWRFAEIIKAGLQDTQQKRPLPSSRNIKIGRSPR